MNKRMLDGSIWANEKFSDMPPMACLLQIGLINLADDQGRMKAHPLYLRSQIFPYRDVTVDEVSMWLSHIVANGTALAYQVDGKDYLQLVNWWQYQGHSFAAPSEYPRPEGWQDRVRFTGKNRTIFTCNWVVASGEMLEDTCDQDGKPLQKPSKPSGTPPSQPLDTPPSTPPSQPVTPLIEDKDKDEDKEKSVARNTPPVPTRTRADHSRQQAAQKMRREYPNVDAALLTTLTNHVKRIYGYSVLIDKPGSDDLEDKLRDEAYRLWDLGFDTDEKMLELTAAWREKASKFSDKRPYGNQLYEEAVQLMSREPVIAGSADLGFALEDLL
jgi:hypothetical protein